jgi:hypothetical protein
MSTFLHALKPEERRILRTVVKKVHLKYHPREFCTDYEADKLIASIGPEVAANLIRIGKDYKVDEI